MKTVQIFMIWTVVCLLLSFSANAKDPMDMLARDYVASMNPPKFEDFPLEPKSFKVAKQIDLGSYARASYEYFRDDLIKGFNRPANFAGKYLTLMTGCGTGCQTYWIVNKETGNIVDRLATGAGIETRLESRLLVRNPVKPGYAGYDLPLSQYSPMDLPIEYYVVENDKLVLIKSISPMPEQK